MATLNLIDALKENDLDVVKELARAIKEIECPSTRAKHLRELLRWLAPRYADAPVVLGALTSSEPQARLEAISTEDLLELQRRVEERRLAEKAFDSL